MRESLEVSTQLTQVHEVDMTKVAKLRLKAKNSFQAQNGAKLTFLPFIAKAVAEALKQHPKLNAAYDEDKQKSPTTTPSTWRSPWTRTRACWFRSSPTPAT